MKKATLLWIDLEMTGLSPVHDRILEVGIIATDWDLHEIATMSAVVRVSPKLMAKRMQGKFWQKNSAARDELTQQNSLGKSRKAVERQVLAFVKTHFDPKKPIYLAGNSIHQDQKFIEREFPNLQKLLHYRMLDVSAWKIVFENRFKMPIKKPDQHRAMSDIRGSIEELKTYLCKIKL
ncbi:MAG: oligoribonuclease [Candidatus Nomurabacteria bacterium]|jgi:oligoribonuclease|nr:oligoribonuclease [Candidatus Nomurabacteria bacterium]